MEYRLKMGEEVIPVQCRLEESGRFKLNIGGRELACAAHRISSHQIALIVEGRRVTAFTSGNAQATEVFVGGRTYRVEDADLAARRSTRSSAAAAPADIAPPMPAVVVQILVAQGDRVTKHQSLIVVAAMKMETTLSAPYDGVVTKIHVKAGDKVAARQILMDLEKHDTGREDQSHRQPQGEDK